MKGTLVFAEKISEHLVETLINLGIDVRILGFAGRMQLLEMIDSAEILVVRSKTVINEVLLKYAINLKLVIRMGSGVDNIDVQALSNRNIRLITMPEGNRDAVGEHAVGLLLGLMNKIYTSDKALRNFEWRREAGRGNEIAGKTVGIIGFGNTGQSFAKKLQGFNPRIIAYDTAYYPISNETQTNKNLDYRNQISILKSSGVNFEMVSKEDIFNEADIISIHIPLSPENKYFVNHDFFSRIKKKCWFLNLSRGEIVQTTALINALDTKIISGAGIDVFENEDLNNLTEKQAYELKALTLMENTLLTPHTGGVTFESEIRMNEITRRSIIEYLAENYPNKFSFETS